jgi:hypothetical protein
MHGNVCEWCDDSEKAADGALHRVPQGGSWIAVPVFCRAASRGVSPPSHRSSSCGLRLARVPVGSAGQTKEGDGVQSKKPAAAGTKPTASEQKPGAPDPVAGARNSLP